MPAAFRPCLRRVSAVTFVLMPLCEQLRNLVPNIGN